VAEMYARGAGPTAIHDRLRIEHPGFPLSLSTVKRLCAKLRRERGVRAEDVAIPVETAPGEVAQVDFGYAGRRYDSGCVPKSPLRETARRVLWGRMGTRRHAGSARALS